LSIPEPAVAKDPTYASNFLLFRIFPKRPDTT
jgi:hypothetical protein